MSSVPQNLKYTREHEWVSMEGDTALVGITDHAQGELGDIVFVELPAVGKQIVAGESFGTVEAVKTVAELYAPVSGEVIEVNTALADDAGVINQDPYGKGWVIKVKVHSAGDLMDAAAYQAII